MSKNITCPKVIVVCRTCLQKCQTYTAIFEHYESNKLLSEILTECITLQVKQLDGLPIYMCNNCREKLVSAWNFKLMAIECDRKFRDNHIPRPRIVTFPIEDNNIGDMVYENVINIKEEDLISIKDEGVVSIKEENVIKLERSELPAVNKENYDKIPEIPNENTEDIFDGESEIVNVHVPDEQPLNSVFGFNEDGVPVTKNGRKLTGPERQKVPILCKLCDRYFAWKYYQIHQKQHMGETPYKCDTCNKSFVLWNQLKAHQKTHTEEFRYVCDICNKRFKYNKSLLTHKRMHTGGSSYRCHICRSAFKQEKDLKSHIQRHLKGKLYICETCGKSFSDSSTLNIHKLNHRKTHPCPVCEKMFPTLSQMKAHEKQVHTDNRPFACNRCTKQFKLKYTLDKHTLIHTGETL